VIVLGAALVLAAGAAGGGCPVPRLEVALSKTDAKQGSILVVRLTSDADLARAAVRLGGRAERLEADGGARAFRGIVGIDFESATGGEDLRVDVEGLCGDAHAAAKRIDVRSGRFAVEKLTVAPGYVEPPESELDRIREDREKVERVWKSGDAERRWSGPFRLPVDAPVREKSFGSRRVFNGQSRSPHSGLDLAAREGQEVAAPAPARVALAEDLYFSGGTVILDHGAGLFTSYFHLSRIDVKAGDVVVEGARVGAVGATGRATGPHLHWSAKIAGARVNPLGLLKLPSWPVASVRNNLTGQSR
jgi:murein DD-endopeptidase MepM/ murein hydrolase activator NlpD